MNADRTAQSASVDDARRIAIVQAMDAAWDRHSQQITLSIPTGCGSHREVKGGEVMGRLGFNLAVMTVIDSVMGI